MSDELDIETITQKEKREINIELMVRGVVRTSIRYAVTLCLIFVSISVFRLALFDINKDTFSITNYGFAIMVGYTSICFSWNRNLTKEQDHELQKITSIAQRSFYSGITFLLGSIFKYIIISNKGFIFIGNYNLTPTVQWVSLILVGYAILLFCFVSIEILGVIDSINKKKMKVLLENQTKYKKISKELTKMSLECDEILKGTKYDASNGS